MYELGREKDHISLKILGYPQDALLPKSTMYSFLYLVDVSAFEPCVIMIGILPLGALVLTSTGNAVGGDKFNLYPLSD